MISAVKNGTNRNKLKEINVLQKGHCSLSFTIINKKDLESSPNPNLLTA